MRNATALLFMFLSLFLAGSTYAADADDIPRISIEELKKMMDSGADIVILDTRPKSMYDEGHIKGALSFPWKPQLSRMDIVRLPKNKLMVTYCDCGPGEGDSANIAEQLQGLGLNEVKVLKDPSTSGWQKAGYPME